MITSIFSSYATNIIVNEIINLFINENMKFTHLYIPTEFNYKIHLISGFEHCFSELEFLRCDLDNNNQNILKELARICKSIKNLGFRPSDSNIEINSIIKLIESQKELNSLCYLAYKVNESFRTSLEKSLIKHVNTLQYLEINDIPITKFLSYLNLISIELDGSGRATCWKNLEDVTLPHLKFLKAKYIPYEYLAKLIENTKGTLNEISIYSLRLNESNNERLIEAIARNCLNLKYLTLVLRNRDITGLEKLLINCQYLNGLVIIPSLEESLFFWIKVFGMLIQFSPIGLFKFKFYVLHINSFSQLQFLNLFFDKWKGRHPMLFQTVQMHINHSKLLEKVFKKIKKYKAEGIVKTYENDLHGNNYEEFEWIKKRI
ncbi:hypothetical protein GLOIN_2v1878750 [Rhizophagus clarus]|nr:hypothetical protein GLOIN_2v1878750 [Rhizophagus clarus]